MIRAIALALIFVGFAAWADEPHHANYDDWFTAQLQEGEYPVRCCGVLDTNGGDAHYVQVRSLGGGKYEVEVAPGAWLPYDKPVNPWHVNPTGENVAWWLSGPPIQFLCLRLANGA